MKMHIIFSSTYKVNRRVEIVTYIVLVMFENYYNKWNLQTKEERNKVQFSLLEAGWY